MAYVVTANNDPVNKKYVVKINDIQVLSFSYSSFIPRSESSAAAKAFSLVQGLQAAFALPPPYTAVCMPDATNMEFTVKVNGVPVETFTYGYFGVGATSAQAQGYALAQNLQSLFATVK